MSITYRGTFSPSVGDEQPGRSLVSRDGGLQQFTTTFRGEPAKMLAAQFGPLAPGAYLPTANAALRQFRITECQEVDHNGPWSSMRVTAVGLTGKEPTPTLSWGRELRSAKGVTFAGTKYATLYYYSPVLEQRRIVKVPTSIFSAAKPPAPAPPAFASSTVIEVLTQSGLVTATAAPGVLFWACSGQRAPQVGDYWEITENFTLTLIEPASSGD